MFNVMFGAIGLYSIPRFASVTVGVGQPAIVATIETAVGVDDLDIFWLRFCLSFHVSHVLPFPESKTCGVGQPDRSEEGALSDVRRTDARSRKISRPAGVVCGFQAPE
jgi:hypothetical protein